MIKNHDKRELFIIILLGLFLTIILLLRTKLMTYDDPNFPKPWDHHKYIEMARNGILNFHFAPFCWRIGVPLLVKLLPFDILWNFLLISFTGVWFTGVVIYYLGKELFLTKTYSFLAMIMFYSLGWATKWVLYDFWLPDALSFLIIVTAIYCIITKRDIYFCLLLYAGVLVKESIVFIIPLYYTFNTNQLINIKLIKKLSVLIIPAILILVSVRFIIPQMNSNFEYMHNLAGYMPLNDGDKVVYRYWDLLKNIFQIRYNDFSITTILTFSFRPFGVFILFASLYTLLKNKYLFLKFMPLIFLVYLQLFFAINTERLLVFAFPAMIVLALDGIKIFKEKTGIEPVYFIPLLLILFLSNIFISTDSFTASLTTQFLICFVFIIVIFFLKMKTVFIKN